jgi:aspartate ammonia-lyase
MTKTRTERDAIGDMEIPADADYGIHTARAVENFPITGILLRHYPEFVQSLAMVKKAAAIANRELDTLKPEIAAAIVSACDLVIAGDGLNHFIVDMLQGGQAPRPT